jgi:hypothetical protein
MNASGQFIEDSFSMGSVVSTGRAGFMGNLSGGSLLKNCYNVGSVSGTTDVGGLVGRFVSATITNSYYDSQTTGQSDTGKGLPRTTLQMQQGTSGSFILPGGGVDTGESAGNAMYTAWSNDIWEFTPSNQYPTLKD